VKAAIEALVPISFANLALFTRSQNVWYQNTRGVPMFVALALNGNNDSGRSSFYARISSTPSGGAVVGGMSTVQSVDYDGAAFIVPVGHYWQVQRFFGGNTAANLLGAEYW
jgi:hypothetical protein